MKRAAFTASTATALFAPVFLRDRALAQQIVNLKVGVPQSQDIVQILYAVKAGLFAKVGLNVELVPLVNGAAISAAVAGGSLQFGMSSLQGLISGHAHGISFQLIAPAGLYSPDEPYAYMFVRKDAPFAAARDLNGKVLASPALKDLDWIANASWMEQNGGDFKSTKAVEMPNPNLLPSLLEGRIDAYTVGEPWSTLAQDSGKVRVLARSFEAIAPRFLMTGWFGTAEFIERNRDTVDRFNRVLREATVYANTHKTEMIPLLAAQLKLDPALIARTMKGVEGEYLDAALIQPMIDATAKYGIIERSFSANELISPAALKRPAR
jgi:NitT/TauT family transport system substrate-binding protein